MKCIGVIGAGNWGTTLAHLMARRGNSILLWGRNKDIVREINEKQSNRKYTGPLKIAKTVRATPDLKSVVEQCELIFVVVPSKAFREIVYQMGNNIGGDQIMISCTKGIEHKTFRFMTEILKEETCCKKVGVLSGPTIATEIIQGDPSGAVIASRYDEVIDRVMEVIRQPLFKVYGNKDVMGVEIGGALKNIMAIASGIATGLGFENNAKAFLVTRGIAEISRYGSFFGASQKTFLGLSGLGDVITTCYSTHSRNYVFGRKISERVSIEHILKEMCMTVEGIYAAQSVYECSQKFNIFMPITTGVYRVIFESANVNEVISDLMTIRVKNEGEEEPKTFSNLTHMLIHKYPTAFENLL